MIDNEDVVKENCYDRTQCWEIAKGGESNLGCKHVAGYT